MADLESRSVDSPDETRTFDKGKMEVVNVTGATIGRATLQPGWKWSDCVKPIAGTESCEAPHTGYVVSGQLHIAMDDGTEKDVRAGEAYWIAPGHDAWVVGTEPYVGIDFTGAANYAT